MSAHTRRILATVGLLVPLLLVLDLRQAPSQQWTTRAAVAGIHLYQWTLSPWMPSIGVICRFEPTCSAYAEIVVRRDGAVRGGWEALRRVARCNPWSTPMGTYDPP